MTAQKKNDKVTRALEQAKQEQRKRWRRLGKDPEHYYFPAKPAEVNLDPHLIAYHNTQSAIAEQLRAVRTNIQSRLEGQASQIIVITSSIKGEGKSIIAANLAIVFAEFPEKKVLLMDCDLRRSAQHKLFGLKPERGLVELLLDRCNLDEVIYSTPVENLWIMPSGARRIKPTVLLATSKMQQLLDTLRTKYHIILIDSPPVLPVTDANILGRMADGTILVIKMGQTRREIVARAQQSLKEVNTKILGCILNDIEYFIPRYLYRYF